MELFNEYKCVYKFKCELCNIGDAAISIYPKTDVQRLLVCEKCIEDLYKLKNKIKDINGTKS